MKYILKYKVKSKYFNFTREYTKEFDNKYQIFAFLTNNKQCIDFTIYEKTNIHFIGELLSAID